MDERVPRLSPAFAGLVLASTIFAYLPALRAGFIWDDDAHVTANPTLRSLRGLLDIWLKPAATPQYYPLVHTSFWMEARLWGMNPSGYHLLNILLHAVNALLLWRVLKRLDVPLSEWIALVFALHPIQVESVAWITERKNVLSMALALLALNAWLRYWPVQPDAPREPRMYWAAIGLFVLALLSKTVVCTLPAVILILIWWKRGRVTMRELAATSPMFLIGAAAGLFTAYMERQHVGAEGEEWSLAPVGRIVLAGRVSWFYLRKIVLPEPLMFIYPRWDIDPHELWQWVFPFAVVVALIVTWLARGRLGRAPFAITAIYLISLFPAMGFFNVYPMRYSYVADHFSYHGSAVAIAGVVGMLALLDPGFSTNVTRSAGAAVALCLAALTFRHALTFADSKSVWRDTIAKNDRAWAAYHNLGAELAAEGEYDEAIELYNRVLALRPNDLLAFNQLGLAYMEKRDHARAAANFEQALKIHPGYVPTWVNLSLNSMRQKDYVVAERHARRAVELAPRDWRARVNLAQAVGYQQRHEQAVTELREAIRLNPESGLAHTNLAIELSQLGKTEEAIEHCRTSLRVDPGYSPARKILINLLRRAGRNSEAAAEELQVDF